MDFVWPYAKKLSYWHKAGVFNELEYSIRSVRKNFQGDVRCFVIGDDPGLDVIHLEAPPLVEKDTVTRQPRHQDQINKLEVLFNSEINEEFVYIYDDVFIMQSTTEEEIRVSYGRAEVDYPEEYIKTRDGTTPYKRLWTDTYNYIKTYRDIKGLKTYDWATHLPRLLEKSKLKWVIDKLNLRKVPKLVTSVYTAHFIDESLVMPHGLQADLWTHRPGMDFDKEFAKKYMNIGDNVIVPELIERMHDRFGK